MNRVSLGRLAAAIFIMSTVGGGVLWELRMETEQQHLNDALISSIKRDDASTVCHLLRLGADANACERVDKSFSLWNIVVKHFNNPNAHSYKGTPSLLVSLGTYNDGHHMFKHVNMVILRALVDHGADVNTRNKEGITPLMEAVIDDRSDLVRFFLISGANVNIKDNDGVTAISNAKDCGLTESFDIFK